VTSPRPRAPGACLLISALLSLLTVVFVPRSAFAEKVLFNADGWQVYTDGRAGGFLSYVNGDAAPVATMVINGVPETINGGLWPATPDTTTNQDPNVQGKINTMRLRSGFIGNLLGIGVRNQITPWTTLTGYIQIWSFIESEVRTKANPNLADVRQGYAKVEGPWGSFLAGRTRTLISRGATDINVLYAHRWGVGFPNAIDSKGPTQGMVGFGVLGSGFAAAMIYATPVLAGFQLSVGAFDPATLGGPGWNGTKFARPEAELTFEKKFGYSGKIVLFANGAHQKLYKPGICLPSATNPCDETVMGVGYGGRFELGPVHLGAAGYYGKGLGLSYALENSYAVADAETHLRWSDGYYVQSQFVIGKFDLFAGWGIARIFLTDLDRATTALSVIKYQMGINGGIVFNVTPNWHLDLEYFRAEARWWLGEKQILNTAAAGMTFNW
jgi:hypothetical protein